MALSAQDLAIRSTAIWSTESAGCLGLSKYQTPVSIWMEKVGNQEILSQDDEEGEESDDSDEITSTEAQSMGLIMQPVIARLYENRNNLRLQDLDGVTMISDQYPWIASHFDYAVSKKHLVECKNFHHMRRKEFGEEGSDDVPMDVLVQCLHEGLVYKAEVVDVAVLFGGQNFEVFTVPVTQDAIDLLVDKLSGFWKYVTEREAPPPQTQDEVKRLFAKDNGKEVIASPEVERACTWLKNIKENMKELKDKKDSLEVEIKSLIADGSTLKSQSGQILATWKSSKDSLKFDKARFMAENPETAARYTSMAPGSRRFLLK
jgi:predicted phage-related endonuclease